MTAPTTTTSERAALFRNLRALHGHRCPMSILGAHLGRSCRAALEATLPPGSHLRAVYFHQTCALDGIQLATGCTLGNGNIRVDLRGQHRLRLSDEAETREVCAELSEAALTRGRDFAALRATATRNLPAAELAALEARLAQILDDLEAVPSSELVTLHPGRG